MKKIGDHRAVILIVVLAFVIMGLVYRILGYGDSFESIHQGVGFPSYDLNINAEIARSVINGKFDAYKKQWRGIQLTSTGGLVYPPLTGYLIAPVYLAAKKFGFSSKEIIFGFSPIPFIILSGAAVFLIVLLGEGYPSKGNPRDSVLVASILAFGGLLFHEGVVNGKFEGVIAFFLLLGMLAARRGHALSAIFFALAACTKQTAILVLLPTVIVLTANAARDKNLKGLAIWLSCFGATILAVFLPFIIGSGPYNIYGGIFQTLHMVKIMGRSPVWYLCRLIALFTGSEQRLLTFAANYANGFLLLACIGISLAAVRKKFDLGSEKYFALITITSFFQIILGKYYVVGIYDVLPTMLLALWCLRASRAQFGAVFLLWQSFLILYIPILYKVELLYITYAIACFYVYSVSFGKVSTVNGVEPSDEIRGRAERTDE